MQLLMVRCDTSEAYKPDFTGVCFGLSIIQCFHGWLEGLDNEYKQYCACG